MVGARQGWIEAPYASVPCTPATQTIAPECRDPRLEMHILAGIRQLHPPDVMRGEETQIAGVLLREPGFEGVICLPGTHTKWAEVAGGIITSFQTFMTGELFGLLSTQSVLRHSMSAGTNGAMRVSRLLLSKPRWIHTVWARGSSPCAPLLWSPI